MEENVLEEILENLGIPHDTVLFLEILENAALFATKCCRKFKPEVMVKWKVAYNNINTKICLAS